MKYIDKLKTGIKLTNECFKVAFGADRLYFLPIMSFICTALTFISFYSIVVYQAGGIEFILDSLKMGTFTFDQNQLFLIIGSILVIAICNYFTMFFNVALLKAIQMKLHQQPLSLKQSLHFAATQWKRILGWTLISLIVINVIYYIGNIIGRGALGSKIIGTLFQAIFGIAWGLTTYFVLPLMVVEPKLSIKDILKESTRIMKETFSENISAKVYLGAISSILLLLVGILYVGFLAAMMMYPPTTILMTAVLLSTSFLSVVFATLFCMFISSMVYSVLNMALLHYAKTGAFPAQFNQEIIARAI